MPFTLDFTLRQHTPILHFQHDQPGATLRVTEIKPKLDRFLIQKLTLPQIKQEGWLIGNGEQKALDYKIKIVNGKYIEEAELTTKIKTDKKGKAVHITDPEMYPQVLANMGGKESVKELKNFRLYETIKIQIFSFHEGLLEKIKVYTPLFWATHNFGNRQTKGFGSFYVDKKDPLYKPPGEVLMTVFDKLVYWQFKESQHFDDTFKDIDIVYRIMKSGFNFPDHPMIDAGNNRKKPNFDVKQEFATYQPSFLKNYFLEKYKIGSEKRAIKEALFRPDLRIQKDTTLAGGNNYIRAILGTAEFFEYRDKRYGKVEIKNENVERFQSAVTFKVFADQVYLLPGDWSVIKGQKFTFETERDKTKPLSVPIVDFDLSTFLVDYATWFNDLKSNEVERLDDVIANTRRKTPELIKNYLNCLENVDLKTLNKRYVQ